MPHFCRAVSEPVLGRVSVELVRKASLSRFERPKLRIRRERPLIRGVILIDLSEPGIRRE